MTERAAVLDLTKFRVPASKVVIIDDQSTGRLVLTEIIRLVSPLIKVVPFSNPVEAIEYTQKFDVDMVITDYMMPRLDGLQTTRELRCHFGLDELPIVMTTIVHSRDLMYRAFEAGVSDYLVRPVDPIECRLRFELLLTQQGSHRLQKEQIRALHHQLKSLQVNSGGKADDALLQRLAAYNMQYQMGCRRPQQDVAVYASLLGRVLGMNETDLDLLGAASAVHDIGEMALQSTTWATEEVFSEEQREHMRQHPNIGHDLLTGSCSRLMQCAADIALNHHERMDGSGYPRGLYGREVSDYSRIVAVADVFNALVSARPWRPARSCANAVDYLCNDLTPQFDAEILQALHSSVDALEKPVLTSNGARMTAGLRHA